MKTQFIEKTSNPLIASAYTTKELATTLAVQPQTLRKRFSQTGSYFGITPLKMPNGKLRWPIEAVKSLLRVGGVQ